MYKHVKDVFNDKCNLSFDTKFTQKVERYLNQLITKSDEDSQFWGGPLTGTHKITFTNNDRGRWFEEILGIDESDVEDDLNLIIDAVKYKVAGDPLSLSCVWLCHSLWNSGKLSKEKKQKVMSDVMMVMCIRFLTSRMNRHWPFPCSKAVAEATLASMSNRYAIKRLGSWLAVIRERADDTVDMVNGIHKHAISRMDIDMKSSGHTNSVVYVVIDNATRIKEMLKGIYNLQKMVQESGLKINSTSATYIETDGESILKDKEQSLEIYKNYLNDIIGDKPSFIKLDLVSIIENANKTMPPQMFRNTLGYISDVYSKNNQDKIELSDLIERIMTHLLVYLYSNRNAMKNKSDIPGLLSKLKGIYTSSRTTDPLLLGIRDDMEKVVKRATKVKSTPAIAATRTGILLYIVLRAFTRNYYS